MIRYSSNIEPLTNEEQITISDWLLNLLNSYPKIDTLAADYFDFNYTSEGDSLSFYTLPSSQVISRKITGEETCQYRFQIIYISNPISTETRIRRDKELNEIGTWLSGMKEYPEIDGKREVISIQQEMPAMLQQRAANGYEWYQTTFNLQYKKEGK